MDLLIFLLSQHDPLEQLERLFDFWCGRVKGDKVVKVYGEVYFYI